MENEESDLQQLTREITENTVKKEPKNPRASARAKLRRRLVWLQAALYNAEMAIDDVFNAPGRTNKRKELEKIKDSITKFRCDTGLTADGMPDMAQIPEDVFDRLFSDADTDWSSYTANTSPLLTTLALSLTDDDDVQADNETAPPTTNG